MHAPCHNLYAVSPRDGCTRSQLFPTVVATQDFTTKPLTVPLMANDTLAFVEVRGVKPSLDLYPAAYCPDINFQSSSWSLH